LKRLRSLGYRGGLRRAYGRSIRQVFQPHKVAPADGDAGAIDAAARQRDEATAYEDEDNPNLLVSEAVRSANGKRRKGSETAHGRVGERPCVRGFLLISDGLLSLQCSCQTMKDASRKLTQSLTLPINELSTQQWLLVGTLP
jgi:hypothetical protein